MEFIREHLPTVIYVAGTAYGALYSGVMMNSTIFLVPSLCDPERVPSQRLSAAQIIYVMDNVGRRSENSTNRNGIPVAVALLGSAYAAHTGMLSMSPVAPRLLATGAALVAATIPYQKVTMSPYIARMMRMGAAVERNEGGLAEEDLSMARKQEAVEILEGWRFWSWGKVGLCFSGSVLGVVAAVM